MWRPGVGKVPSLGVELVGHLVLAHHRELHPIDGQQLFLGEV
jgi:hypothetical protein